MLVGYTTMVLSFMMVYFGVRSYRDNVAGGSVSFGRSFKVGIMITALASVCYVATWQLVYHKISPDFFEKYSGYTLDKAKRDGATDAEVAAKAAEMACFNELLQEPVDQHLDHLSRAAAGWTAVHPCCQTARSIRIWRRTVTTHSATKGPEESLCPRKDSLTESHISWCFVCSALTANYDSRGC